MAELFQALSGVPNLCQALPSVMTGGQPTAAHLTAAREAGLRVVLDIRDPMEPRPFDEPTLVANLGMTYVNIPVSSATMNHETWDRIRESLQEHADENLLFHCNSGSRVGGVMIAHLVLDHGFTPDDAVNEAMRIGLRSPDLIEWSLDYVARHQTP